MKKIGLIFVLCLIIVFSIVSVVNAEDGIVETPHVKIVINGELSEYTCVPLSMNQRTLLPLREILTNLGVENDDEHIIWNGEEKSVTVLKDDLKLYLKIGSETVYVNDEPVELDVAPIGYTNQRIYIPARFVSEALGKKVVWDGSSKTVLIRNEDEFNEIKDIIEKSDAAMEAITKCKVDMDVNTSASEENFSMDMGIKISGEVDMENTSMHLLMNMDMLGFNLSINSYFQDYLMYVENPMTGEWQKGKMTEEEYDSMFSSASNTDILDATDAICAGLVLTESENPDEILLKGDIYLGELFDQVNKNIVGEQSVEAGSDYNFDDFYVEMSLDKETYLMNSLIMSIKGNTYGDEDVPLNMSIKVVYSEINGDFEVVVPQEVLDNAVEVEDSTVDLPANSVQGLQ